MLFYSKNVPKLNHQEFSTVIYELPIDKGKTSPFCMLNASRYIFLSLFYLDRSIYKSQVLSIFNYWRKDNTERQGGMFFTCTRTSDHTGALYCSTKVNWWPKKVNSPSPWLTYMQVIIYSPGSIWLITFTIVFTHILKKVSITWLSVHNWHNLKQMSHLNNGKKVLLGELLKGTGNACSWQALGRAHRHAHC